MAAKHPTKIEIRLREIALRGTVSRAELPGRLRELAWGLREEKRRLARINARLAALGVK